MNGVILKSSKKINNVGLGFKRYLYNELDLKQRFIAIKGARGAGKTTLLLQLGKKFSDQKKVLYIALDDLYFIKSSLYDLAEEFQLKGGEVLLLDEVHKYSNWSRELKLIYDDFSELQIIFTSSSILNIYKGESDLSRRVSHYVLKEMSFREFLILHKNIESPAFTLKEILANHTTIAEDLVAKFRPFEHFDEYLKFGALPFYENDPFAYQQKLLQTIHLILEIDVPSIENIDYRTIEKMKRLLYILASNVPFTPNINKLSTQVDINRNALVRILQLMDRAFLIHTLYKQSKSVSMLNKPDKIWLRNTNFMYAIAKENVNKGTLRETFALQSLAQIHEVTLPPKADFLIDKTFTFEVGGKSKSQKQIAEIEDAYVFKDEIEVGIDNIVPLWLLGMMY